MLSLGVLLTTQLRKLGGHDSNLDMEIQDLDLDADDSEDTNDSGDSGLDWKLIEDLYSRLVWPSMTLY